MNTVDKITKDLRQTVVNSINDVLIKNLTKSVKDIGLNNEQINRVLKLVEISIDEGFHRSVTVFQNTIKKHLEL